VCRQKEVCYPEKNKMPRTFAKPRVGFSRSGKGQKNEKKKENEMIKKFRRDGIAKGRNIRL